MFVQSVWFGLQGRCAIGFFANPALAWRAKEIVQDEVALRIWMLVVFLRRAIRVWGVGIRVWDAESICCT